MGTKSANEHGKSFRGSLFDFNQTSKKQKLKTKIKNGKFLKQKFEKLVNRKQIKKVNHKVDNKRLVK